ncbi:GFA family protein [Polymorphobacter sp.]|uniref:GFA family protein n=1 Tax=Polymorphobacter sp. TaxID=1909290 RepID=UPI003F6F3FD4
MTFSCLCGSVQVELAGRPDFIHACNCSLCSKTGAEWAYLAPDAVGVAGATSGYVRGDKADAGAEIRFCGQCGSTTHFVLTAETVARHGNTMVGVNMRLADPGDLAGIERRFPDGRAWSGAGDFGYVRAPEIIGETIA